MSILAAVLRAFGSLVFGCLVLGAFIAYLGSNAVEDVFLHPEAYKGALEEEDVYNRVYDELLVDAQFQDKARSVMGGYEIPPQDVASLSREVLPPAYLQAQVEAAADGVAAYLRKDASDPRAYIDLNAPMNNIRPAVQRYLNTRIDGITLIPVATPGELSQEFITLFLSLERGVIPQRAPSLQAIPVSLRLQAYDEALASYKVQSKLNAPVSVAALALEGQSAAIRAAISVGDVRGALRIATLAIATPVIDTAVLELRQDLDSAGRLDLVEKVAEANGETRAEPLKDSDRARDYLDSFNRGAQITALTVMALATALLMAVHLPQWRYSFMWSGFALLAAGVFALLAGLVLKTQIADRELVECGALPASACDMLSDVSSNLISSAGGGMLFPALIVTAIGGAFMLLAEILKMNKGGAKTRAAAGRRR
ncbi:MAG: hypothetical protein FJ320_08315 [SAR202 cluster bacterium]|nr:hypothetical protein [SAR202 cluster bacterium]